MSVFKNKILYFLLILVLGLVFFVAMMVFKETGKPAPIKPFLPTPTKVPPPTTFFDQGKSTEKYLRSAQKVAEEQKELIRHEEVVAKLANKLPYNGDYFTLFFDHSTSKFYLTLDKNNVGEANKKFDEFLKENGILDRSWIRNLVSKSK